MMKKQYEMQKDQYELQMKMQKEFEKYSSPPVSQISVPPVARASSNPEPVVTTMPAAMTEGATYYPSVAPTASVVTAAAYPVQTSGVYTTSSVLPTTTYTTGSVMMPSTTAAYGSTIISSPR